MSNEQAALWYVIHTYSGYENKVAANIERMVETRGLENLFSKRVFRPKFWSIPKRKRTSIAKATDYVDEDDASEADKGDDYTDDEDTAKKRKTGKPTEHKLFPSYVLVKMIMNDETWHIVRNIRGVTGFVGPGSKPVPLTEREVEALGVEVHVRKPAYAVGDSVMVVAVLLPVLSQPSKRSMKARDASR